MANVTPFRFFRTCRLGGCERVQHGCPGENSSAAPPGEASFKAGCAANDTGIQRRSEEPHSTDQADQAHQDFPALASTERTSRDGKETVPATRMPDFVFGVIRKQASAAVPGQTRLGHPVETRGQFPCPISSSADAGLPACESADPDDSAAPGPENLSAHLFTSYALKARR